MVLAKSGKWIFPQRLGKEPAFGRSPARPIQTSAGLEIMVCDVSAAMSVVIGYRLGKANTPPE